MNPGATWRVAMVSLSTVVVLDAGMLQLRDLGVAITKSARPLKRQTPASV